MPFLGEGLGAQIDDDGNVWGYSFYGYPCIVKKTSSLEVVGKMIMLLCMQHPNFVRPILYAQRTVVLFRRSEVCDSFFVVMERVVGSDMLTYVANPKLSIETRLMLIERLVGALMFLSAYGLVHADLHGQNIMISDRSEQLFIIDIDCVQPGDAMVDLKAFFNLVKRALDDVDESLLLVAYQQLLANIDDADRRPQSIEAFNLSLPRERRMLSNITIQMGHGILVVPSKHCSINVIDFARLRVGYSDY